MVAKVRGADEGMVGESLQRMSVWGVAGWGPQVTGTPLIWIEDSGKVL